MNSRPSAGDDPCGACSEAPSGWTDGRSADERSADERSSDELAATRRRFLQAAAAGGASAVLLSDVFGDAARAEQAGLPAAVTPVPRQRIARLEDLQDGQPLNFELESVGRHNSGALYKLGVVAGGGVGPQQDIVAFSSVCTHMGDSLAGRHSARHRVAGPCPAHLTTFDLTRHGIVVAGHATQPLPQFVLEIEEGQVYVTSIAGLLYGHHENPTKGA